MRVACGKNSIDARVMRTISSNIPATVQLHRKISKQSALYRTSESHRKQYKIGANLER